MQLPREIGARQQHARTVERSTVLEQLHDASPRNSAGVRSMRRPNRASRPAVDGPTVQMRTPFRSRMSPIASSRSMKWSTPLALVKISQS